MTQKSIETRIYEGNRAAEVLSNEVFQAVWTDLEQELTEQWKKSPARDEAGREKIWAYLQQLGKLKSMIETTLTTGKLAVKELEHRSKMQQVRDGLTSWRP